MLLSRTLAHRVEQGGIRKFDNENWLVRNRRKKVFFSISDLRCWHRKLHSLNNFTKILERLGATRFDHAGFFATTDKSFKQIYWKSTRRRRSVMKVVVKQESYVFEHQLLFLELRFQRVWMCASKTKAAKVERLYPVRSGPAMTLGDFDQCAYRNQT